MNVAKKRPTQAVVVPTGRPDEYRLSFPLSPAKRLLELQRQRRLRELDKK